MSLSYLKITDGTFALLSVEIIDAFTLFNVLVCMISYEICVITLFKYFSKSVGCVSIVLMRSGVQCSFLAAEYTSLASEA